MFSMWKYRECNAYDSISLHDCRASTVKMEGSDLVIDFPDGFLITAASSHIDQDRPLKTGPAQLRFHEIFIDAPFDSIDLFKTTRLFGKPILCRRLQPEYPDFLKIFASGRYELEFITEYHAAISTLYQCWIWKKNRGMVAECQFQITAKGVEYCWNEILKD